MYARLPVVDTFRRVAGVYREQAGFLVPVALVLFVLLGLIDAASDHLGTEIETDDLSASEVITGLGLVFALIAGGSVGEEFYAGVAMSAVSESMAGRPRPPLRTIVRTVPYLRLILVSIIFALVVAIGVTLLVVPGVVFFTWFVLAAPLVKIERLGVWSAFRRSRQLVRGNFLPVLVVTGGIFLLSQVLTTVLQSSGIALIHESFLADWAVALVVGVITTPIWAVAVNVVTWRLLQMERRPAAVSA
jgi:hypothetical protein